ncbi:GNAT family N-acetyltransferase [Catalinimonas niigatensis]|uniref:GNAT family N-acetyltransferase n=1 Tax=Catalinimonas niigatensis TaxID=1397264 RepID=UPI0026656BB9|nr:GNAT family protein [Catalinimonas niigatensis]WPP52116.1 GNAT family protein [Catalinimonas niigatensis]
MKKVIKMELIPIKKTTAENQAFIEHPDCQESIYMTIFYFERAGFYPPWIAYYAQVEGKLVGAAAFKGKAQAGKVEIAYGTFPQYRKQGIGTEMCRKLVILSQQTDPQILITARTLPENKASVSILKKNGFELLGRIWDKEDGNVLEWKYTKSNVPDVV